LASSVAPNQTNSFTFNITAPSVAGDYSFQWRMVDDEGSNIGWFGANSALQTITVSSGAMTTVPWVTNMTVAAAGTSITNAGLVVSGVSQEYHATVAAGRIFSQTPGGNTSVARGSSVALAASLGPASTTTVPWVTNMTVSAAGISITNAGLVVSGVNHEYHATVAAGRIFSQTPGGGTSVARGSSVALAASLGPQPQLVLNNSFETNTASWTLTGSAARSTTTHAGSGVASLRINTTNGFASQPVTIVSGKTYDISVYAYVSARTAGQVVFDTGDKYDGTGQGQFVFNAANGGWNKSSGVFTATNTSLTVRMFAEGFAGTAYFDLIELKPRN
jgi:beta-lactam-binding protein with PASTA domain